jgi:hypothetical protein
MWNAWGGDAGFSWSRAIVKRNEDKALFADFGKDYTRAQRLTEVFKADQRVVLGRWSPGILLGALQEEKFVELLLADLTVYQEQTLPLMEQQKIQPW